MKSDQILPSSCDNFYGFENSQTLPILIIGYRRAEELTRVFSYVRKVLPGRLFIAMDGPRNIEEQVLTEAARSVAIREVDWPCQVQFYFAQDNIGCKGFVLEALSWFFDNVEVGIVLEDDILMHHQFPAFASQMLLHHNVGIVSACTYEKYLVTGPRPPAFLSKIPSIWGWACTNTVWNTFLISQHERPRQLGKMFIKLAMEIGLWQSLLFSLCLRLVDRGLLNTWDYEFAYFLITHKILCAFPSKSMACNIGFSPLATHSSALGPLTPPLSSDKLELGNIYSFAPAVDQAYMSNQALNTPFYPIYRLHVISGLVAHWFELMGLPLGKIRAFKSRVLGCLRNSQL